MYINTCAVKTHTSKGAGRYMGPARVPAGIWDRHECRPVYETGMSAGPYMGRVWACIWDECQPVYGIGTSAAQYMGPARMPSGIWDRRVCRPVYRTGTCASKIMVEALSGIPLFFSCFFDSTLEFEIPLLDF